MNAPGIPWSEEEHQRFLLGLRHYGRGEWRLIAKHYIKTRSPGQVASHAQKYFKRIEPCADPDALAKRRWSIHDMVGCCHSPVIPLYSATCHPSLLSNLSLSNLPIIAHRNCEPPPACKQRVQPAGPSYRVREMRPTFATQRPPQPWRWRP